MCWKYEDQYHNCFDPLFFSEEPNVKPMDIGDGKIVSVLQPGYSESLVDMLRDHYGAKVVDENVFRGEVFDFLSKMHERGVIVPGGEE